MLNLTLSDWLTFLAIFGTSIGYYFVLKWWSQKYPEHFDDNTWLAVVIGCGYVILWQILILPFDCWFKLIIAFFVASPPIIYRSLHNNAKQRRELCQYLENNGVTNGKE